MKRILVFSLAYYPYIGGAEVAIKEITNRIPREEIAFDIITLRFSSKDPLVETVGNVRVYRIIGAKVLFPLLAAVGAYRLHKKFKYDALWAMMSYMLLPIIFLRLMGVRLPYALTLQEGEPYKHVFRRFRIIHLLPLLNWGFRNASVVQTISTFLAQWATQRGFTGALEVIPNGVDTEHFAKAHDRFVVRKELNIREDETVLVTSSRLVYKNAVDDVIRALPALPRVHFLVLGSGPDERTLKELAAALKVAERVHFVGQVSHERLPAYLQASTIFIRPSRSEGMGNSFVEAMAAGLPVIATQEGGIADFLFDAKLNPEQPTTGWAVDKDSPEQIVQAVKEVLGNPEKAKKVVENARSIVFSRYDWNRIARDMRERVFSRIFVSSNNTTIV